MYLRTCSESALHPYTLEVTHCRYDIVISSISFEFLGKGDSCQMIYGGGVVSAVQVGVGWICTIVNSADVFSL